MWSFPRSLALITVNATASLSIVYAIERCIQPFQRLQRSRLQHWTPTIQSRPSILKPHNDAICINRLALLSDGCFPPID
ncbi:hypothetical protein BC939DRAFT_454910 [Gamsiella multidivaricata]|uniref:uncharacterized protein n=1 Tax=Gamsiella multidivaricata TaxID=101098 RepID=UPI00221FBD4F|nr:uncharacterized protein BC939DRAFT_454910 [Gamsiella multidivaricata]KAI7821916.1 hypothetical protein BC939DRAFT_454910 [Gamsiella multidivaricata]